jgi:hypothetical protein
MRDPRLGHVDFSGCEHATGNVAPEPAMMLPIGDGRTAVRSLRGDGFLITVAGTPPAYGLLAIGSQSLGTGYHYALSAADLRQAAAQLLRAASLIDGGDGVQ